MNARRAFLHITFHKKLRRSVLVSLLLFAGLASQAAASPSFTTTISFFQGFDISTAAKEGDPARVRLLFGATGQAELVPVPGWDEPFSFSAAVDVSFGYDIAAQQPITFVPENIVGMAVLKEMAFETVDSGMLDNIELTNTPVAVSLDEYDTAVILTTDDAVFKIGNVVQQPDVTMLQFSYQPLRGPEAPEPATLLLLGLGLLGLLGFLKRKNC